MLLRDTKPEMQAVDQRTSQTVQILAVDRSTGRAKVQPINRRLRAYWCLVDRLAPSRWQDV